MNSLSESEREELLLLTQQTERMQERIESLEAILDEQTPDSVSYTHLTLPTTD